MKIAVSSEGKYLDSFVSPHFGRAPYFVFLEVENKEIKSWEAVENPYAVAGRGAGIASAQLVASKKADVVLTGNIGPNSFSALAQVGIKIYFVPVVKVKDAVDYFFEGKAQEASLPRGGWGWRRGWGWGRRW